MTCPNCGASVADNRRFCGKCGAALTAGAPPDPAAAAPAPVSPAGSPPSAWGAASYPPPPPPPASPGPTDPYTPPDLGAPPGWAAPPHPGAGYPPPNYGGGPPPYPPPAVAPGTAPATWPGGPYGYAPPHTNGLAIASLVLGLTGWLLCGVGSVLAIVLGFVSRDQIKRSWGRETGSGMATAGIILGFIGAAFWLVVLIAGIVNGATNS